MSQSDRQRAGAAGMTTAPDRLGERLTSALASLQRLVAVMELCPLEDDDGPHWGEWQNALDEARMVLRSET